MIYRLILSALFLAGLVGCQTTGASDPRWHHAYQEYLAKPHYRAFAATGGAGRLAASIGWSWRRGSVEDAIENALAGCSRGQKKYIQISKCELFAVGDIKVAGMSGEQIDTAIALYTSNRYATTEDLSLDAAKTLMSGEEIQELYASGAKMSGIYDEKTSFTIEHFSDGTATVSWKTELDSGNDTGIWRVKGNESCKKWGSLFDGVESCWAIYRVGDDKFQSYKDDRLVATWSVVK